MGEVAGALQLDVAGAGYRFVDFQLVLVGLHGVVNAAHQGQRDLQLMDAVAGVEAVYGQQVVVLRYGADLLVALHQLVAQVWIIYEQQHVLHGVQPLLHRLPALGGVQAEIQAARRPLLGAHGHGHKEQSVHFVGPGQRVVQSHARAEGEPGQHQPAGVAPLMEPVAQPVSIARHVLEGLALQVAGQVRGQRVGKTLHLVAVGRSAPARAGAMNQD